MTTLPNNYLILDVETTIRNKGNPFTQDNKLCYVGVRMNGETHLFNIEYDCEPYNEELKTLTALLESAVCIVGFNLKFDLHWIRNYIPSFTPTRIWDAQLFEFIRSNQNAAYPSLDECCLAYGIPGKVGDIASKYWDQGIDTTEVPEDELRDYLRQDLMITEELFKVQHEQFTGNRRTLFLLHCMDEIVLEEIEYNGLLYNTTESVRRGDGIHLEREVILQRLADLSGSREINWNSSDHLSVYLFGGFIKVEDTEIAERTLKSGAVKRYERKCIRRDVFSPRLDPSRIPETKPTSEWSDAELLSINTDRLSKGLQPFCRIYSVSEDNLKNIRTKDKTTKEIIQLVLKLANLKKLETTYYYGLPQLISTMNWPQDKIHGTINQCRVITGRTSSSKPNLQNFDGIIKELFYSRYADQPRR